MNFKQNSLFTRNTGYEEEPMESQGGVLAVWGSPSAGKTVVSVKLADYLARKEECTADFCRHDCTAAALYLCVLRSGRGKIPWEHSCCNPCNGKPD